jgi:MoaA/NifB/PqqE/SkfB family radical SAM enzyme
VPHRRRLGLSTLRRFVGDAVRARLPGRRALAPLVATYHVTSYCNLNCTYCEDFGLARNRMQQAALLPLADARHVLRVLRTATENLILTGGEALLHPAIEAIVEYAAALEFRYLTLITNGLLLPRRPGILPHLSRLVISMDTVDPATWDTILATRPGIAARIIETIERHAALQATYGYRLVVNCVVMPHTIGLVRDVIAFCRAHGIGFSVSPQGVGDHPHQSLVDDPEYRRLMTDILRLKDEGEAVVGSRIYLRHMLTFEPFQCHPTLNVRVLQNGDFVYPCRPIAERHDGRGGVGGNLLDFTSFEDAFVSAVRRYGPPPVDCRSCFQQCFAEPSLLVRRPLAALGEAVRGSYAP